MSRRKIDAAGSVQQCGRDCTLTADMMSISKYDVDSLRALRQSCRPSSSCSDPFGQKFAIRACRAPAVRPRAFCARVSPFATSDDSRGYASSGETELTPVHVRDDRVG